MSATVIIPTTGAAVVKGAIESVLAQEYPTTCYLVVDGIQYQNAVWDIISHIDNKNLKSCVIPINVGANGFYGHRAYAAFTHLVDTEYVCYLDQDNWMEPNHIQTCIDTMKSKSLDWCHSLRNIHQKTGEFVCRDDCESLGKHLAYTNTNHIDTNTYFLKTEIATKIASAWHGGWGQDRVFLQVLSQHFKNWDCTGKYTINYRVEGQQGSVNTEFFVTGNKIMSEKYGSKLPWTR